MSRRASRALWLLTLLVPPIIFFTTFVVYPIGSALVYSLYEWEGIGRRGFVGLANFRRVLFQAPYSEWTWNAFRNNVTVFVSLMIVQNGWALVLAFLLSYKPRGNRFYQVVFFMPVILSLVIIGFQWRIFLNPIIGLVNNLLRAASLDGWAQPWLGQEETALWSLIFVNAWAWVGFPTIVFLAGILSIPKEYFEAARLDGANEWQLARWVTWPLIAPSVTIIVVLTFIGSFNWFELPYVMAGVSGSPYRTTDVLGLYFYRTAFGTVDAGLQDFGRGSALAVLMFLFILIISVIAVHFLRKRETQLY